MIEILNFMFKGFWHFLGCFLILCIVLQSGCNLITRTYRMVMVSLRGWPPSHLDADGDWNEYEETNPK